MALAYHRPDPRVVFRPELRMSSNESETQTVELSHCGDFVHQLSMGVDDKNSRVLLFPDRNPVMSSDYRCFSGVLSKIKGVWAALLPEYFDLLSMHFQKWIAGLGRGRLTISCPHSQLS